MRTKAFGVEPEGSLLDAQTVARACLDTMLSDLTGHVIDLRRADPFASHELSAQAAQDIHEAEPSDEMPEGADAASEAGASPAPAEER